MPTWSTTAGAKAPTVEKPLLSNEIFSYDKAFSNEWLDFPDFKQALLDERRRLLERLDEIRRKLDAYGELA
jgi:hypothetical protein